MSERISFIRLPILLLCLFFLGKLIVGAAGGSYELGNRLFAMVPLTVHLCLVWGAISRVYRGQGIGASMMNGVAIAFVAQALILIGTAGSYLMGAETHFNNPVAVTGAADPVGFGTAMGARGFGLLVNCIIGSVAALIGWALGNLVPARQTA